ncbi:zinc-binding dehydrogenase [Paenibacillus taihuensis]|uniref:zinc-binding dehydrogenase n=1 Tax=Paenibacillus taihuensis TaxID=1156355 RepID=UPI001C6E298C
MPLLTGKGRAHHGVIMEAAANLAELGELKVNLDPNRFTFEQVNEAFKLMEDGKASGKVAVRIQE